jgi:hypothetical protein
MAANSLLDLIRSFESKFDLVGPTVDDDIRRAISRYGVQAVKDAVKRQTKAKRGRKAEKDWPEIDKVLKEDARKWLDGGDPFADRSNYSIAQAYANQNPGHSHAATHRRIMNKLAEKREIFTLINAYVISQNEYPYSAHLRTLRALIAFDGTGSHWEKSLELAEGSIADYTAKHGPPSDILTMKEVEHGAKNSLTDMLLKGSSKPQGLLGMYARGR